MAVEALLGVVFEKSLSLIQNEFATIFGIKGKIDQLSKTLYVIKAVLEDAEEKQMTNKPVKVWLQQLKDAVYVLDDILDECSIESHRFHGLSTLKPRNIKFRRWIGSRLKEIMRRFDEIANTKNKFLLNESVRERPSAEVPEWRQTFSIITQPQVYGRDEDKEKIVEFLLNQAETSNFPSIFTIVGLGGLGKTTLAQMVYNDERVSTHFNIKIWICVSENFSVPSILCFIIESILGKKTKISNLEDIAKKVQELLRGKRYLLVLDDVWKKNQQLESGLSQDKWNKLKSVLSCGPKGASVLVSTRDEDVARIMGTRLSHHLSALSEDDCWLLFKQYAFGADKEEDAQLVAIGKGIARKCGGSPLAAQALGSLMNSKNGEKEWLEIKESMLWSLPDENDILPALRLSYFHLLPTSKQCFSFCAVFPKDTLLWKEDLIHLWMANGFISFRPNMEVEDVGDMIWNELRQKSFFQDIKIDEESGDISFKMHDLVHDLAQSVMGQESMILDNANMINLSNSTHHISIGNGELSFNKRAFEKIESLRTLYQLGDLQYSRRRIDGFFSMHRSIRVLRTRFSKLSTLQNFIHLRYLELYGSEEINTLPDSICYLQKLEILKLLFFPDLSHLPNQLSRLQNLRHLIISRCSSLSSMFPNIGRLSFLRTLSVYIVKVEIGHSLAELGELNLGGFLSIACLNNVSSVSEAQKANLKEKKDLRELSLSWDGETKSEQIFEALQPHSNLKSLIIFGYEGLHFPSWISDNFILKSLVFLRLSYCPNLQQLPPLGKLPSLRKLEIEHMYNVQCMDDDESYDSLGVGTFASLEQLTLTSLQNLEKLLKVESAEMFLHLSQLSIRGCHRLQLPFLPSVECLSVNGCNNELLKSISSFISLTYLKLVNGEGLTSFPEGMMTNLTCLRTLIIQSFEGLKELPNELLKLNALEHLEISCCHELESFPEQGWEGLCSLRTLKIDSCEALRSFPEGVQHLTSLEILTIYNNPTLKKRCDKGIGEDWHKIAHVPRIFIY